MRRLTSMLAAGLLAAGTLFATAGAASAGVTGFRKAPCTTTVSAFLSVTSSSVTYNLGTPNKTFSGAAVRLKPTQNSTTLWTGCLTSSHNVVITNRGLALTTSATTPGANVTVTTPPAGGGFLSQQWIERAGTTAGTFTYQSAKTGLFLRIRNSGPIMGQAVTTGSTPTAWTFTRG
jgi:hypothetical protein